VINILLFPYHGGNFMKDPIVEEVRAAREAITAKFKFNIHAIVENARRHQAKSGHKILKTIRHPPQKSGIARGCP